MDRLVTQAVNLKFAGVGVFKSGEGKDLPGRTKKLFFWPFRMEFLTTTVQYNVLIFKVFIPGSCDRPAEDLNVPLTLMFSAM